MRSRRQLAAALVVAAGVLAIWGCANHPPEHFFLIPSWPAETGPAIDMRPVAVQRIAIPALIERPQLVVVRGQHEVAVLENQRWAEPLADGLTRAVIAELRAAPARLPAYAAQALRGRENALTVDIHIEELLAASNAATRLKATWTVRNRQNECQQMEYIDIELPTPSGDAAVPTIYAEAMRRLGQAILPTVRRVDACAAKGGAAFSAP